MDDGDAADVSALVNAANAGDQRAWDDLVLRYGPLVMSILARYQVFGADAEDVAQVVWMRLVEHLGDLREPRALPKWLITTTRNECIRLLRANRRCEPLDRLDLDNVREADPHELDDRLLQAERRQALLAGLAGLSERDRSLLLLLVHEPPLSYVEIGRRLGIPVGSIGPTRARALRRLRSSPALAALFELLPEGGGQHGVAVGRR